MRKIHLLVTFVILLALIASIVGCAEPTPTPTPTPTPKPEVIELTMTSNLPEPSSLSQAMRFWASELEKRTGGQVTVPHQTWGGALLKSDALMQGLGDGVVDVAFIGMDYTPALLPLTRALTPTFLNSGRGISSILKEFYETVPEIRTEWGNMNIRPLYFCNGSNGIIMTGFEFDDVENLKAKRIRAVGQAHNFIANLGGVPVSIAAGEAYIGMQKGTIDGVAGLPAYTLLSYKLAEVINQATNYRFGCYTMWMGAGMNMDTYNSLPEDVKKVIDDLWEPAGDFYAEIDRNGALEGLDYCKENGVRIVQLSPEKAKEWQKIVDPPSIWESYIKETEAKGYDVRPLMDKLIGLIEKYEAEHPGLTDFERWNELNPGYLEVLK